MSKKSKGLKTANIDSYQLKKAKIAASQPNYITVANEVYTDIRDDLIGETRSILSAIKNFITPEFIQRIQSRRIHQDIINNSIEQYDEARNHIEEAVVQVLDETVQQKEVLKQVRTKLRKEKHLRDKVRVAHEEADEAMKEALSNEYNDRQRGIYESKKALMDARNAKDTADREIEEREYRIFQERHWRQQADDIQQLLLSRRSAQKAADDKMSKISMTGLRDEWEARDLARARMQVETPYESSEGLWREAQDTIHKPRSIFGSHTRQHDWSTQQSGDFGDVHLFSASPLAVYEEEVMALNTKTSELRRDETLYSSMQTESRNMMLALSRILQLRETAEREYTEANNQLRGIEIDQLGPPRRLPTAAEIRQTHIWKTRMTDISNGIAAFQTTLDKLVCRRDIIENQMVRLAKKLAIERETLKASHQTMNSKNGGLGHLPIVIGKKIEAPRGFTVSNPMEIYQGIVNKSRFTYMQEGEEVAIAAHKDRFTLEQKLWLSRLAKDGVRDELNITLSKLAAVSGRLQQAFSSTSRSNVVEALEAFFQSGISLHQVNKIVQGSLDWFSSALPTQRINVIENLSAKDSGCIYFEAVDDTVKESSIPSVVLAEGCNSGSIEGQISLPKSSAWMISLVISNESQDNNAGMLRYDYVTVRLGSSEFTLSLIGTFYNDINPDTNAILHEIHQLHYGSTLAYKFEFYSSTSDISKHLVVNCGMYTEFQMEPLECHPDLRGNGRERVISDYVKRLRVAESQGTLRMTKLLEELINVEASNAKTWNASCVFQNSPQRYNREILARLLRAEILIEHRLLTDHSHVDKTHAATMEKIQLSNEGYLSRKRAVHKEFLEKCANEVGKRLDVYDDHHQAWRKVRVEDCIIKWIENGTKPLITHVVQEYDDQNVLMGSPYECNLMKMRYFVSTIQTFDNDAKLTLKDHRMWEERIDRLRVEKLAEVKIVENALQEYKLEKETALQAAYDEEWAIVAEAESKLAQLFVNSNQAKTTIKTEVERVDIDIRRGNLDLPSLKNAYRQKVEIAKERIEERLIRNKKAEFDEGFQSRVDDLESDINERSKELDKLIQKADRAMANEVNLYKDALREKKKSLLARVKFDPTVFAKAVPKVTSCEHMKTKAWGTFYGKGVRCMSCNKELTRLHLEESQYTGFGSGMDPQLNEALNRHRNNESTFRFRNADELKQVEDERIRLEKERRIMELSEIYFYDYDTLTVIHDFDRRHNITQNKEKNETSTALALIRAGGSFDDDVEPAPTFRAADDRRRAQYDELNFVLGRIQIFHRKIESLKAERLILMNRRSELAKALIELHGTSFSLEDDMDRIEMDLNRTNELLGMKDTIVSLWIEAKKLLERAIKDKRSAEMRLSGKWDDVKEASDSLNFVHDEMRTLLKLKFLCDLQLNTQSDEVEICNERLAEISRKRADLIEMSAFLLYCRPGDKVQTKYGEGVIRGFRPADKMLLINLSFCNPPAKVWLLAEEIFLANKAKQNAERMRMEEEDVHMKQFITDESLSIKKELFHMRLEESRSRKAATSMDFKITITEQSILLSQVELAVRKGMILLQTPQYKLQHKLAHAGQVKSRFKSLELEHRSYDGPPSGAPPRPTIFSLFKIKKEAHLELKEIFLSRIATKTAADVLTQLKKAHKSRLEASTLDIIIHITIEELILDIAKESLIDGKNAKSAAQRASGLIIPNPQWMQFDIYSSLIDLKKNRRKEVKFRLQQIRGVLAKLEAAKKEITLSEEDVSRGKNTDTLTQEEKDRMKEKKRQEGLCGEMSIEEAENRIFYKWELLENLRERRQMKDEEISMRELLKEEALFASQASEGMKEEQTKPFKITSFEKRRQELKMLTLERGKQAEELARMTLEDARSKLLQEVDKADRLRIQYEKEFGIVDEPDIADQEGEEGGKTTGVTAFEVVRIPSWMEIPENWENWMLSQQKEYVILAKKMRILQKRINKRLLVEKKTMEKLQAKCYLLWEEEYYRAELAALDYELKEMEADEELKANDLEVNDLRNNQRRLFIICREKGEKEIKARQLLQKRQALAIRYDRELKEASAWLQLCTCLENKKFKLKKQIENDVKFIDIDSINGFWQRIETKIFRETLYNVYFSQIINSLVTRAETIVVEREIFRVEEKLTLNKIAIIQRAKLMRELISDIRRETYMRMKRSALTKLMFGCACRQVLESVFGGWVRFFLWNRGHREAFELQYEVLKTRLELDRQFRKDGKRDAAQMDEQRQEHPTLMQYHKERPVQCKNCNIYYIESQNISTVCRYHIGEYLYQCPKSCENPGKSQFCIVHKVRRWTCCDVVQEDAIGCCQKYHVPLDEDPVYKTIIETIGAKNIEKLDLLTKDVEVSRHHNWIEKHDHMRKKHFGAIQSGLHEERQNARRFHEIKF